MWRTINSFKGTNRSTVSTLKYNDLEVTDTQQRADIHARHFQGTMTNENRVDFEREDLRVIDAAANDEVEVDYNVRFKMHELVETISELDPDKAYGEDQIHNQFLIHLPNGRRNDLLGIINRLWRLGVCPNSWKLAQIIPILKSGKDPLLVTSFRPISLLSCLGKAMEKMVCKRLTYFLETNDLLRKTQYGFRAKRSTVDPILSLEHEIRTGLVNRKVTVVVFFI